MAGASTLADADVQHVRMDIPRIDALGDDRFEAMAAQASDEIGGDLVAEGLAEGEVEGGGEALLQAVPRVFHAGGRIVLLDQQCAAGF